MLQVFRRVDIEALAHDVGDSDIAPAEHLKALLQEFRVERLRIPFRALSSLAQLR